MATTELINDRVNTPHPGAFLSCAGIKASLELFHDCLLVYPARLDGMPTGQGSVGRDDVESQGRVRLFTAPPSGSHVPVSREII